MPSAVISLDLERALRLAAVGHRDQVRKGSGVPYVEHPLAVALLLDRAGFADEMVIAGLLHDLVEDTDVTLEEIGDQFGVEVAAIVAGCSETKVDASGQKRPWLDRKRDHLAAVAGASLAVRAVVLADKFHNLLSIELDLRDGRPVWQVFHADRDQVLWYHARMIEACRSDDPRLASLAAGARALLDRVAGMGE